MKNEIFIDKRLILQTI